MSVKIRKLRPEDTADVEYVCRMTAGPGSRKYEDVGNRMAKMYASYYARECCDTSYVLADENDRAVGYLFCETSYKKFRKVYRKKDVPIIKKLDKKSGRAAWFFPVPYTFYGRKYPAHLHIDILDDYQNGGYGTKMMNMLLDDLKKMKIPGVMLIADTKNEGAIRFYERNGFEVLGSKNGETAMGKRL